MTPDQLLYTKTHEWIHVETEGGEKIATLGLSAFALELLTDLVFVDLPEVGRHIEAGETFGEIESVKAVSDLYCPIAGDVVEVNAELADRLETLTDDPYETGWFIKIKVTDDAGLADLFDQAAYTKQCAEEVCH